MSEAITLTLKVGDKVEDDSLVILDEDRLCYSVRSVSNGGVGVRTISKALLAEWVGAYKNTPNASSQTIREQLVGKSEIDRFEYGYAGTLAKMAKMILGQIPVVRLNAEDTRRKEFYDWMLSIGKAATYAKDVSKSYLPSISNESKPPSKSMWHGLREYLYNEKPPKKIYEINSLVELDEVYAGIDRIFGSDSTPGAFDPQRFNDCWTWAHNPANHNSISAAWNLYKQFMQWHEAQQKKKDETKVAVADLLTVALKMFSEKRKDDGEGGWFKSGREVNGRIREYFDPLTVAVLQAFDDAKIEELFCGKKGADGKVELETMWSGKPGMGWGNIKPKTPQETQDVREFLCKLKADPGVVAAFRQAGFVHPKGFGPSVISELLMKFHPESCIKHGEVGHKVLTWLGLIDSAWNREYSDGDYKQVCGAAAKIIAKMKAMNIPRQINADGTEDTSPPDYLTVNEFLWFVHEYKDTISKECEAKMMKKADYSQATSKPAGKKPKVDFGNAEDVVLLRLAAALRAKPFAILAGHSGTGKSRMVRKLAYMTCARGGYKALLDGADGKPAATPGNFCMVQVKPNWHDSTDLLGYYSEIGSAFRTTDFVKFICKAYAYPDVPFFVCLDEMNLAPVEQYFAEYLSAIESRKVKDDAEFLDGNGDEKTGPKVITDTLLDKSVWKSASDLGCEFTQSAYWVEKHGLTIPRNLFVVGTVNMDESTNQFSRKVLDRAFTLEMTDADFEHFGEQSPEPSYDDYAGDDFVEELLAGKLFASDLTTNHKLKPTQVTNLNKLKPILADTSFVVAYRFANEYALYEDALEKMLSQFDSSTGAGGASAGTSAGAAEAPAADGATQPATGAEGAAQPAAADGTQQPGAEGTENSQGAASPSTKPEAFDDMILMKLLPRITGDAELVLKIFAGDESAKLDDANVKGLAGLLEKKGASFKKMKEIVKRGGTSLTFWP